MNFDIKDVKSWSNRYDVKIGDEGYFFYDIDKLRNFENEYIKPVKSKLSAIRDNCATCFQIDNGHDGYNVFPFFLPLGKVQKTEKRESTEKGKTFDLWIANKVKVRVVTNVDDFDKTLFSILGVIEKCEKQGILLKDQNNKEHFICYPNILEVQYLGTDDWKEYLGLSTGEIDNI